MATQRRRYKLLVLAILVLVALSSLVRGVPEPAAGKRDLSYHVWYPGQAVAAMVSPQIAEAGRLNSYAQLPVAFFINVLLYGSLGLAVVQGLRRVVERLARKLGAEPEAGEGP